MSLTGQTGVSFFDLVIQKISSSKSCIFGGMHRKEMRREGGRTEILDSGSQSQVIITVPSVNSNEAWQSFRSRFGGSASHLGTMTQMAMRRIW